jgi:hypothetical protein
VSGLWSTQIRVADLLAERAREADVERLVSLGEKASPTLATRLAFALRGAADLLDAPRERPGSQVAQV